MAQFDRYDICVAYAALEYDWNVGGWLRERPSNQRRMESVGVQLHRMGFKPAGDEAAGFDELAKGDNGENRVEIYLNAVQRFGMGHMVNPADNMAACLRERFDAEWVKEHFPQVAQPAQNGLRP